MLAACSVVGRNSRQLPLRCVLLLSFAFGLAASAQASSLVTDGGFESATGGNVIYSGSSLDGGSWSVLTGAVYIDSADPYVFHGNNSLNLTLANLYVPNTIGQTLATVAGQTYLVSFYANADASNTFAVTENGTTVAGLPASIVAMGFPSPTTNSSLFVNYTGEFVASSSATTLDLTAAASPALFSANGSVIVDDVSVAAVAATPEPSSLTLMLTGVACGLELIRRRRFAAR